MPSGTEKSSRGQLGVVRRGWENEHLAAFILSKFAFLAQPVKNGDDLGTDFFCNFFIRHTVDGKEYLIPTASFAIQVKSSTEQKDYTKQINYLSTLELPYFVGVVDREDSALTVYSAENLPYFWSHKGEGNVKRLWFEYCDGFLFNYSDDEDEDTPSYCEESDGTYSLKCPKIAHFRIGMGDQAVQQEAEKLRDVAKRVHRNIAARTSEEHVYELGPNGSAVGIVTGPESAKFFRDNFKKRLAEALSNLERLWKNGRGDRDECMFYLRVYDELSQRESNLPRYLTKPAENLSRLIENATAATDPDRARI